jgi:predicted AAA+ superfamily ATPase
MPSDRYVRRFVDDLLDDVTDLPAILLDGAKGVGKTATARRRCTSARFLDEPGAAALLDADPYLIAADAPPVLIDEWQRSRGVWDAVRRIVDASREPGRFFLTGSLPPGDTHSGAGRIHTVRMRPMCLAERGIVEPTVSMKGLLNGDAKISGKSRMTVTDYTDEILASGFPGLRGLGSRSLGIALDGYLDRVVDRDIVEAGHRVRQPDTLRSWLRAYAAATATAASWETVRSAASGQHDVPPTKVTTASYTEALIALGVLDPVEPWLPGLNHFKTAGQARKHHLVDPALAARLLRRSKRQLLTGDDGAYRPADGTLLGNLFESLAALTVRNTAIVADARVSHYRDNKGRREVDFVVVGQGGVVAIECKLGSEIGAEDVRHLHWLRDRLGTELIDAVVVNTGPEAYRRKDGVAVVPLALLGI